MMSADRTPRFSALVLVGAHSCAGRAIAARWGDGPAIRQVHRNDGPGWRVNDYATVPADVIPAGALVVNCVGTPRGEREELDRINRQVPLAWLKAARRAGAAQFVQLSSFAVYGRTETIAPTTPERPANAYGAAKLAADRALLAAVRDGGAMDLSLLRIPMLFGRGKDKLRRLVDLACRARAVPRVTPPVRRSMLSYDALAEAVWQLGAIGRHGVVHAADPTAFSYELLAQRIGAIAHGRVRSIRVPRIARRAVERLAPGIHAQLLASSLLNDALRMGMTMPAGADLVAAIDAMVTESRGRAR